MARVGGNASGKGMANALWVGVGADSGVTAGLRLGGARGLTTTKTGVKALRICTKETVRYR